MMKEPKYNFYHLDPVKGPVILTGDKTKEEVEADLDRWLSAFPDDTEDDYLIEEVK